MNTITRLLKKSLISIVPVVTICLMPALNCVKEKPEVFSEKELFEEPVPPQMIDVSLSDRELSLYLVERGFKFAREWDDSMRSKLSDIMDKDEHYRKWEELKNTTAPALLGASLDLYRAALIIDSTNYSVHHWISYPLSASGDREGAIAACEKYIESIGDSPNLACAWLGRLYYEDGQKEKALETFKKQILYNTANEMFYKDTMYYLELGGFTPEEIEEVLSLSELHKGK
ncbi:tetratricopeptide repeat protein [Gemmatimonadota bacterium]